MMLRLTIIGNYNDIMDDNAENWAIMQNMIFDSVFEVDSVSENESDFF